MTSLEEQLQQLELPEPSESFNVYDRIECTLFQNHIRFLDGSVTPETIQELIKWIVYENIIQTADELTLYINSIGGELVYAFALIDVMNASNIPIRTIAIGCAASAAFLIFASGTKGLRFISKNTSAMSHPYSYAFDGKYHDIKTQYREIEFANDRMTNILQEATGLDHETIRTRFLSPTDNWFSVEELLQLNVADNIF